MRSTSGRFAAVAAVAALACGGLSEVNASLRAPPSSTAAAATTSSVPTLSFGVLSDWGGTDQPPYTTPGQLAAAGALEEVATNTGMDFVVSAGNNFLPAGLEANSNIAQRFNSTWASVYDGETLSKIAWFATGGYADWAGNVTAEHSFTNPGGVFSRWQYPSLWQTFTVDPVQIILLDTVTLTGEMYSNPATPAKFSVSDDATNWWTPTSAGLPPTAVLSSGGALGGGLSGMAGSAGGAGGADSEAAADSGTGAHSSDNRRRRATRRALSEAAAAAAGAPDSDAELFSELAGSIDGGARFTGRSGGMRSGGGGGRGGDGMQGRRRRKALDFNNAQHVPSVSTAQWWWLRHILNVSTVQWIVVIGNDPVYSAGANGPNQELVSGLMPLLQQHGVALYVGGRDPLAQHFSPTSEYPAVDVVTIGNGAVANATMGAELPSAGICPEGSLQFSYGNTTGFLTLTFVPQTGINKPALMTVTFYNDAGVAIYSFSKTNPRIVPKIGSATTALPMTLGQRIVLYVFLGSTALVLCWQFSGGRKAIYGDEEATLRVALARRAVDRASNGTGLVAEQAKEMRPLLNNPVKQTGGLKGWGATIDTKKQSVS